MHFIQHAQLWDTDWWMSYLMSSYSTRHNNQTASSSSHCYFIFLYFLFLDVNQNCAVIKIWFCAASLGKQVWVQEERKQPHSIWHTRVITGGRVLGHLYSVWGGGEVPPHHLGSILSPWRVRYQVCVSPALTITGCKATFHLTGEGVLNQNVNIINFHVTITKCNQGYEKQRCKQMSWTLKVFQTERRQQLHERIYSLFPFALRTVCSNEGNITCSIVFHIPSVSHHMSRDYDTFRDRWILLKDHRFHCIPYCKLCL